METIAGIGRARGEKDASLMLSMSTGVCLCAKKADVSSIKANQQDLLSERPLLAAMCSMLSNYKDRLAAFGDRKIRPHTQ